MRPRDEASHTHGAGEPSDTYDGQSRLVDSDALQRSFPLTVWPRIEEARLGDEAALEDLARRYATPIFCYFRQHGCDREFAKDLTQEFLIKLTTGQFLEHVEPGASRFRSFLKRSLKNMLIDFIRRGDAGIRNPTAGIGCLADILERAPNLEPAAGESPEEMFDREYALTLLSAVILQVRSECESRRQHVHFACFSDQFLVDAQLSWDEIGARYDVSAEEARQMTRTVQAKFKKALIEEIREPGMTDAEVEDEIRELIQAFRRSSKPSW